MDIRAALEEAAPAHSGRRCKIQRWLDDIPDETPGKDDLVAVLTSGDTDSEHYRTLPQLSVMLFRLGLATDPGTIGDHRSGQRCRCYR